MPLKPVHGLCGGSGRRPPALPLALLLLALATVFLFGGGRSYLESSHVLITQNHMTVAMNLSPEHGFLGFYRSILDHDGNRTYEPYNRFPLLGHVLIKWAFAMRHQSHKLFEGMFDVGLPLVFFALMLPRLDRRLGGRVRGSVLAGLAAAPLFVLSSFLMARSAEHDPEHAAYTRALAADVDSIRELAEGKTIFVSNVMTFCNKRRYWRSSRRYYFTGSAFVDFADRRLADFVVSERIEGARTLTPGNRLVFLYDRAGYDAALSRYEQRARHGAPVLDSPGYDVHLVEGSTGNELLYFHDHCPGKPDVMRSGEGLHVFLHVWPSDANDLPADRRRLGFDDLVDFRLTPRWRKDGKCYAVCRLPDYDIARVHTGWAMQRPTGTGHRYDVVWEGGFSPGRAAGGVLRPAPDAAPPQGVENG